MTRTRWTHNKCTQVERISYWVINIYQIHSIFFATNLKGSISFQSLEEKTETNITEVVDLCRLETGKKICWSQMLREVYLTSGINTLHTMQWPLWKVSTSRLISGETQSGVYHSCHSPPPDLTYHHLSPAIRQGCLLGQQMILSLYVRLWQFKKFIYKVHITGTLAACSRVGRVGRGKGREGEMFLPSVLCQGMREITPPCCQLYDLRKGSGFTMKTQGLQSK